ncbi:MAG: hypothetical protein MRERC_1c156 [Mycoplasmataceae bacterium RC_NB112A]|nr:MAG: hypothetical protein MRERC_1c156 [Mycoplasmataceae bacterium RC_NB112A]
MTDSNKITIKFDGKEYEIEKTDKEQKVKPKNTKTEDKEITVKNYQAGKWNHTCQCSKDGSNFEKVDVKWGSGKHVTIWGGSSITLIGFAYLTYRLYSRVTQWTTPT